MKAVDFLTYYLANPGETCKIKMYNQIVSQPFLFNNLPLLFNGGFSAKENDTFFWFRIIFEDDVKNRVLHKYNQLWIDNGKNVITVPQPVTINDFISDCARAGVTLEFNPKISQILCGKSS
jgi:hypothetical protein